MKFFLKTIRKLHCQSMKESLTEVMIKFVMGINEEHQELDKVITFHSLK